MEAGSTLNGRPWDNSYQMWLHWGHGWQVSQLGPLATPRPSGQLSVAQAFVAEIACAQAEGQLYGDSSQGGGHSSILGLPCRICGPNLYAGSPDWSQNQLITKLFLAEISSASCPLPSYPDMFFVAIIAPSGAGLASTSGAGTSTGTEGCWFVFCNGRDIQWEVLDTLCQAGCLRYDFDKAFLQDQDTVLGEGAYATVHCMRNRVGEAVAVKKLNSAVDLEAIEREVATLLEVQPHEYIVGFRGLYWHQEAENTRLFVGLECAPHGDLLYKVLKFGELSESAARPIFLGIMAGISHIHTRNIVHRDIKAENVLLKREDCPVIADFGLATHTTDAVQMARRCGSPGYVAPEVCLGTPYGLKVDVFAAGVILYFLLSKEMPFSSPDRDTAATMRKTVKCSLHLHRPPWDKMSSRLRNLLRLVIRKDQNERIDAATSLEHPWMLLHSGGDADEGAEASPSEVPSSVAPDTYTASAPPTPYPG